MVSSMIERSMAIFDLKQIHPGIAPSGALLSAVHFGEGKGEDRLAELHQIHGSTSSWMEITYPP